MIRQLALVSLVLVSGFAQADIKAAFINPAIILEQSPQAIKAGQELKQEFQDREVALRTLASSIQGMEAAYKKDSVIMNDEQRKKEEDKIIQGKRKFQFDQQSLGEDVQNRRKELIQVLRKSISEVIKDYGIKHGYDFIFTEGVAFASDKVNVTSEVMKELELKQ
ncbi:MAG: outer membrane protein [Gammaproteobacteria bacterium]|jgi:outer membrane protein